MKTNKGSIVFIAIGGIFLAASVLYFPAYLWFFPYLHDKTLDNFAGPFVNIQLPERTQEVDRLSIVGHQSGNSDHCDYLAAKLLKTDLSKSEVEKYYRDKYAGKSQVHFFWTNEPHEPGIGAVNPTGIYTLNDWINIEAKEKDANLVVYIFEGSMTSALDPRCS